MAAAWLSLAAALLLILIAGVYAGAVYADGSGSYAGGFDALLGFMVMHYYVEARVWKFSRPHNRETTLPLLNPPVR